jgi:hypothetical protein
LSDLSKVDANPLDIQVGGGHYKDKKEQPVEFMERNGIGYCFPSVLRYVERFRDKSGAEDLRKALHCLHLWSFQDARGQASRRPVIGADEVLLYCDGNQLCDLQTGVLVAVFTDVHGERWLDEACRRIEHLLVSEYGAKAGE